MSIYNNHFVKQPEKIDGSSDFTQIENDIAQLYLEDNKLQGFSPDSLNEIVKEMCIIYNEEKLKGKYSRPTLNTIEQFLIKKRQNPEHIVKFCLNHQVNSTVQIIIASCYYYGKWIEMDKDKAFVYYQKSAEMGDDRATYMMGYCYQHGTGVEKDGDKAFIYYQKSAEMGNAAGLCQVGYCCRNGIGVEKDEYKAFIYYQRSAEMGDAVAIYNVGYCYFNGIGVEKNKNIAFIYYQKSAKMNYANGVYMAGYCYLNGIGVKKDEYMAFIYYQKSAEMEINKD